LRFRTLERRVRQSKDIKGKRFVSFDCLDAGGKGNKTLKKLLKFRVQEKPTDENIMRLVLPSVLGIILCMVCLCGTTWAWFSGVMATGTATVQAARYTVEAEVEGAAAGKIEQNADGSYALLAEDIYTVRLTVGGTAEHTAGYCKVTLAGEDYYTGPMRQGDALSFTVSNTGGSLSVLGLWGTYSGEVTLKDGDAIVGTAAQPLQPGFTEPADTDAAGQEETTEAQTEANAETTEPAEETTTADTTAAAEETTTVPEETTGAESAEETTGAQTTALEPYQPAE